MTATYDRPPADEELQSLVDPVKAPHYLRLEDDGTTLTARPLSMMWFFWLCMLPVVAVAAGSMLFSDTMSVRDPDWRMRLVAWFVLLFWLPASVVVCRVIFGLILDAPLTRGPFFALDRAAGTLTLLRTGVVLRPGDVAELVEVRATHTVRHDDGSSSERLAELTALARDPDGTLTRHSVVVSGCHPGVRRATAELADFFGVPVRRLVTPLFWGTQWRRVE